MAGKERLEDVEEAALVPFHWVWHLSWSILTVWFVSCAIHIGYVRWHHLEPAAHMESLIGYYVDQTGGSELAIKVADKAYWLVFEATSGQRALLLAPPAGGGIRVEEGGMAAQAVKRGIWGAFRQDLIVAGYATVLLGLKLGMFLVSAVLFGLLLLAAVVDGLVQREIRRACGGNESASIYHRAKKYGMRLLPPFAAMLFFCSPVAFDPGWLFVPTAIVSAVLMLVQVTYYKKYA